MTDAISRSVVHWGWPKVPSRGPGPPGPAFVALFIGDLREDEHTAAGQMVARVGACGDLWHRGWSRADSTFRGRPGAGEEPNLSDSLKEIGQDPARVLDVAKSTLASNQGTESLQPPAPRWRPPTPRRAEVMPWTVSLDQLSIGWSASLALSWRAAARCWALRPRYRHHDHSSEKERYRQPVWH